MGLEIWFAKTKEQDKIYGPLSMEQLQNYWRTGKIAADILISRNKKEWYVAEQLIEGQTGLANGSRKGPLPMLEAGAIANSVSRRDDDQAQGHVAPVEDGGSKAETEILVSTGSPLSRYEIIKELGRGGMGVVYQVMDTKLKRVAAAKMLLDHGLKETSIKRFMREAELSAKMSHPNIVHVYDFGTAPSFYIIMEFIEGRSFQDLLEDKEYPLAKKLEIFRQVCEGIEYAHQQKIIHRDLKPQNIMVTTGNIAKIMDFGLAKSLTLQSMKLSKTGQVMGTVKYMSPEQAEGHKLDHRTDIYSLGVILYKILTGRTPYESDNVVNILTQLTEEKPILPSEIVRTVPKTLEAICMKCLEKKPEDRYETAKALGKAIQAYQENKPVIIPQKTSIEKVSQWMKQNKKLVGMCIALVLCWCILRLLYEPAEKKEHERIQQLVSQKQKQERYEEAIALWNGFLVQFPESEHRETIEKEIEFFQTIQDKIMESRRAQAEAQKKAEEQRLAETKRQADEAEAKRLAEEQIQAEAKRQAEEAKHLANSYGLPLEVWKECHYEYKGEVMLDMTTDVWCRLSPTQQSQYASRYQKGYAAVKNLALEKEIPIPNLPASAKPLVMRLIPPGRFWMGSPENEEGHDYLLEWWSKQQKMSLAEVKKMSIEKQGSDLSEGPQHRVVISSAFYLSKYECTQAQWKAVMGNNPSYFQHADPDAPVEQVAWTLVADGKESFCGRIGLSLPSEACWEYSCRAGTTGMSYVGDFVIKGEHNAPGLSAIAWYGGNSGVSYEGGDDSSSWPEKEQNHKRAGTHPVGKKLPNGFGLYDMLGNVLEWCSDNPRQYRNIEEYNPFVKKNVSVPFVFRGGSWYSFARNVRCAYRYVGTSLNYLGFRVFSPVRQLPPTKVGGL